MKPIYIKNILVSVLVVLLLGHAAISKAQVTLDCESGHRDIDAANCWVFGGLAYRSITENPTLIISGNYSARTGQLTNPDITAFRLFTPWLKPSTGNITFKTRLDGNNGTWRALKVFYLPYGLNTSVDEYVEIYHFDYPSVNGNSTIYDISIPVPIEIADSDEVYRYVISWIGQGGTGRAFVDDLSFPGTYWSNTTGCIALPLPNAWTGDTDRQWELNGNWSRNHQPLPHHDVTIPPVPNQPIISSDVVINSLVVEENVCSVTMSPVGSLRVVTNITNSAGVSGIVVKSDETGTGSLIHNDANLLATIERYIPPASYHLVSVPLQQSMEPMSGLYMWSYLFQYNIVEQSWFGLNFPTQVPLSANRGYMVFKYAATGFQPDTVYTFAGAINSGSFQAMVEYPNLGGNFSLVPNPYPSSINWNATSGWTKTNLSPSYWVYVPQSSNYGVWDGESGTNGLTSQISTGQAFFVSATASNPVLDMNNAVRVHNTGNFFKSEETTMLRMTASSPKGSDEIVIRFSPETSSSFDPEKDSRKMYGGQRAPQLYAYSSDEQKLSIYRLPLTSERLEILLGFEQKHTGEVTFAANSFSLIPEEVSISLYDNITETTTNLREMPSYTFVHDTLNVAQRFKLVFNSATSVSNIEQLKIEAFFAEGQLHVNLPQNLTNFAVLNLYSVTGQLLLSRSVSGGKSVISVPGLPQGIYLLNVTSDNRTITTKLQR